MKIIIAIGVVNWCVLWHEEITEENYNLFETIKYDIRDNDADLFNLEYGVYYIDVNWVGEGEDSDLEYTNAKQTLFMHSNGSTRWSYIK